MQKPKSPNTQKYVPRENDLIFYDGYSRFNIFSSMDSMICEIGGLMEYYRTSRSRGHTHKDILGLKVAMNDRATVEVEEGVRNVRDHSCRSDLIKLDALGNGVKQVSALHEERISFKHHLHCIQHNPFDIGNIMRFGVQSGCKCNTHAYVKTDGIHLAI